MRNKLTKKFNEMFFRNFQDTDLIKLSNPPEKWEVEVNLSLADDYDTQMFYILHDISEFMFGDFPDTFTPLSDTMCEMVDENIGMSAVISEEFNGHFAQAEEVAEILKGLSTEACLVGGAVRDFLINKVPNDFDFCTDTDMDTLEKTFKENGFKVNNVGKQFLVLIASKNNQDFEIANFRKDKDNAGGEAGTIEEDGNRRDFTIGAGFFNLTSELIIDPTECFIDDIKTKTLRFVGKPKDRLEEDPLRAFRFMRFVGRGFTADKKSLQAVRERVQNDSKRITELQLVLTLPGVSEAVETALEFQRNDNKMVKRAPTVTMSVEELSETILSLERIRLEIEKMVGL